MFFWSRLATFLPELHHALRWEEGPQLSTSMQYRGTLKEQRVVSSRCLGSREIYLSHLYEQFMNCRYEIYGFSYQMIWMSDFKPRLGAKIFVWAMTGCAGHGSYRGAGSQETFHSEK
jgi:hypothetical protein